MSTSKIKIDYYRILGVEATATTAEITKAYYKLAKTEHPDRKPEDPHASEHFKNIVQAYTCLKDESRRKNYDLWGEDNFKPESDIPHLPLKDKAKIWIGAIFGYLLICLLDRYTSIGIEWIMTIIFHVFGALFFKRQIEKVDFGLFLVSLILFLFAPTFIVSKLASLSFVFVLFMAINLVGPEPDLTALVLILSWMFELFVRQSPVLWKFTACHSLVVSLAFGLGLATQFNAQTLANSLLYIHANQTSILILLPWILVWTIDFIASLITPQYIFNWTFPTHWIVVAIAGLVTCIFLTLGNLWKLLAMNIAFSLIGVLLAKYVLPNAILSFIIALAFYVFTLVLLRAVETAADTAAGRESQLPMYYWIFGGFAILGEIMSGHYATLGSANWNTLAGILTGQAITIILASPTIILVAEEVIKKLVQDSQEADQDQPQQNDLPSEN